MKPFLHNEVFAVNDNPKAHLLRVDNVPVLVVDEFFSNFEGVRELVGNTPAGNWKITANSRNFKDYYDCRLTFPGLQTDMLAKTQSLIQDYFKYTTHHLSDSIGVNWFQQIEPRRADHAFPHSDKMVPREQFTCLVYLNDEQNCSGGTGFFKQINPNAPFENGDDYWPKMEDWEMTFHVRMVPNRLVIFPAHLYHAAYQPMDYKNTPRLTLVYWMAT